MGKGFAKQLAVFGLILTLGLRLSAQSRQDSMRMVKAFGQYEFLIGNSDFSAKEILDTMKLNPEAYKEMKKAIHRHHFANVLGYSGGTVAVISLFDALSNNNPIVWPLVGAGAGVALLSIPFTKGYIRHARKAISIYNAGLKRDKG